MLESLLLILALPWYFILVVLVLFMTETFFIAKEKYSTATWFFIIVIVISEVLGLTSIYNYITSDILSFLGNVGNYLLIGLIYASLQWILKIFKCRSLISKVRDRFIKKYPDCLDEKDGSILSACKLKYLIALNNESYFHLNGYGTGYISPDTKDMHNFYLAPRITDFKAAFFVWLLYWPFHAASYLITDILDDVLEMVFNFIKNKYQYIADKAFAKFNKDI